MRPGVATRAGLVRRADLRIAAAEPLWPPGVQTTVPDPSQFIAPLAGLNGAVPPAPAWFTRALAVPFETYWVEVQGARLECRAWGERGRPGLVLIHGNAAHLGWWSFLAPYFAGEYRVVTWSLSGMGRSDWRERYAIETYTEECWAVAEAGGACDAGPPVLIGHSLGSQPVIVSAARRSERMRSGIIIDCGFPGPELPAMPVTKGRSYPDIAAALDRFRLAPPQPCDNLFIVDYLARMGLKQLEDDSWTYRFDRKVWGNMDFPDLWAELAQIRRPLAVVRAELSEMTGGTLPARLRAAVPAGTPFVEIPEAHHQVMMDQPLALVAALRGLLASWAWRDAA
jgi:pimeloyl-ACP methyl ester carboxylesterase